MPRSFLIANKRYHKKLEKKNQNEATDVVCLSEPNADRTDDGIKINKEEAIAKDDADVTSLRNRMLLTQRLDLISVPAASPLSISNHVTPLVTSHVTNETYPIGLCSEDFYTRSFRAMLPSEPRHFVHSFHRPFLPTPQTDINFNRLNDLVDKVFDGLRVCDIYTCATCGKQYSTPSNLARHKQIHRDMSDKKARKCPHCEKIYVSMPAFSMHVRTHNEGCACPYCGKRFSRPWLLQGHIRTHTGEKPFKCNLCPKAFADKSNLRAHIQTHSTEKPYVCGRCGKAFALKSYLSKHEESSCMKGLKYHKLSCAFNQRNN